MCVASSEPLAAPIRLSLEITWKVNKQGEFTKTQCEIPYYKKEQSVI